MWSVGLSPSKRSPLSAALKENGEVAIIQDAIKGKISWLTAGGEIVQWFEKIIGQSPASVHQELADAQSALKQAASDAIGLAGTALGAVIGEGVQVIEPALSAALTKAIGANATALTPAIDSAIEHAASAFKAEVDAVATALRAKLSAPVQVQGAPVQDGGVG